MGNGKKAKAKKNKKTLEEILPKVTKGIVHLDIWYDNMIWKRSKTHKDTDNFVTVGDEPG
jgi:thiamine kinase-like enzyme